MSVLQVVQWLTLPAGADAVRGVLLEHAGDLERRAGEGAGEVSVKVLADDDGGLTPICVLHVGGETREVQLVVHIHMYV